MFRPKTSPVRVKPNRKSDRLVAAYSAENPKQVLKLGEFVIPIGPRPMVMYALKLAKEQQYNKTNAPDEAKHAEDPHLLRSVFSLLDSVDDEVPLPRSKTPRPKA